MRWQYISKEVITVGIFDDLAVVAFTIRVTDRKQQLIAILHLLLLRIDFYGWNRAIIKFVAFSSNHSRSIFAFAVQKISTSQPRHENHHKAVLRASLFRVHVVLNENAMQGITPSSGLRSRFGPYTTVPLQDGTVEVPSLSKWFDTADKSKAEREKSDTMINSFSHTTVQEKIKEVWTGLNAQGYAFNANKEDMRVQSLNMGSSDESNISRLCCV
ncbi:unnamed protein product [Phytophthora lilii]|uniref:Unnamed protein product n=1 Tax=Phytophthora lilii TaxID=2077276 RepID=A0A9W6TWE6_9STRA|nr:unnamed protein product [Phytophthora lilii]